VPLQDVRRGSNSQPSVPKFEADRFRNSRRNHEIDRSSLPVNDFGKHIPLRRSRQFHRSEAGKRYRFEESSNPIANPTPYLVPDYEDPADGVATTQAD
jgi:hypothetical protein